MRTSTRRRILFIYVLDCIVTVLLYAAGAAVAPHVAARARFTAERVAWNALDGTARAVLRTLIDTLAPKAALADECFFDVDCADGNVCNGIERCVCTNMQCDSHVCVSSAPIPCDDGNPCTDDQCDPAIGCSHAEELCPADCTALADGTPCIDGTTCTVGDFCEGGTCMPGLARDCPDIDECTSAQCDAVFGCMYTEEFVSPPCVPECTGTVADFTRCPGDADICTIDACLPSTSFGDDKCIDGLLFGRQCADGDLCNGDEWCSPVLGCQTNTPRVCDDGDACTGVETCDAQNGCEPGTPLPDGSACDDHLTCTVADQCAGAHCAGNPLTAVDCDDSDPTTTDACREGFGCLSCRALDVRSLAVKFTRAGRQDGRVKARGKFAAASGVISPASEAVTLMIDLGGSEAYRAALAAGALAAVGTDAFAYVDKTGTNAGLRLARLNNHHGEYAWKTASADLGIAGPQATSGAVVLVIGDDCFSASVSCEVTGGGKALRCG